MAKFRVPKGQVDNFVRYCTEILTTNSKHYISRFSYTIRTHFLGDTLKISFCFPFLDNIFEKMQKFEFLIDGQSNDPPTMSFYLNCSSNKEITKGLGLILSSQKITTAQFVKIKAEQKILHLFIIPRVFGVDLQSEEIGDPEATGIREHSLQTLSDDEGTLTQNYE